MLIIQACLRCVAVDLHERKWRLPITQGLSTLYSGCTLSDHFMLYCRFGVTKGSAASRGHVTLL